MQIIFVVAVILMCVGTAALSVIEAIVAHGEILIVILDN